nr:hypothetical protein [Azospirillum oleiclasticum]
MTNPPLMASFPVTIGWGVVASAVKNSAGVAGQDRAVLRNVLEPLGGLAEGAHESPAHTAAVG